MGHNFQHFWKREQSHEAFFISRIQQYTDFQDINAGNLGTIYPCRKFRDLWSNEKQHSLTYLVFHKNLKIMGALERVVSFADVMYACPEIQTEIWGRAGLASKR